jgi:hypothetical protein
MIDDAPKDWFIPTTFDNGERGYSLTREGVIFFAMKTDGDVASRMQVEIAQIVTAWYRGEILPRSVAPTLIGMLENDDWEEIDKPPEPASPPVEIVGGVSGLQKLLVKRAGENRGLDHAALKQLYDAHQVVIAVWESDDKTRGPGFLTLKGTEHLLAQAKRGAKKTRATMTAIPCTNKEHAELLQQAFMVSPKRPR